MPVNGESKRRHEQPVIVKSNLKLILVFVKHPQEVELGVWFKSVGYCGRAIGAGGCV